MPDISLTTFVDFVAVAGRRRITIVRDCKMNSNQPYDPRKDFYKRLRENITAYEKGALSLADLKNVDKWDIADKKSKNFQDAVDHYILWRSNAGGPWRPPAVGFQQFGELKIRVNPELGFGTAADRNSVKLHFKKDEIPANRMPIIHALMLGVAPSPQTVHILDVRREKLFSQSTMDPDISILLEAEAAAFMSIWISV